MLTRTFLCITALLFTQISLANEDAKKQIATTLNHYIVGSSYNYSERINQAFANEATLYLQRDDKPIWQVTPTEYSSWFSGEKAGEFNGRIGEIISIDVSHNTATAKAEILLPTRGVRYIDTFLLKRLESGWKIISKTATQLDANNNGQRILFIVSNTHFHGNSDLPAGVSFFELVKAYEVFKNAGYTVDFVSPEGGAIPLAYINTSIPIHKQYLYNRDFMYALGNTKKPDEIDPAKYRAVYYVGGSNAMYGITDNKQLQAISMAIYEQHEGVISAVCHGTAGIVNLQSSNGEYLVKDKRISGYPEAYENQTAAYFTHFPLLIQQAVEERGGRFFYAERNTSHVEVDGRVVTGQNHLSSALVAEHIVAILNKHTAPQN